MKRPQEILESLPDLSELKITGGLIAMVDQIRAANKETNTAIIEHAGNLLHEGQGLTARKGLAWSLALVLAVERRIPKERRCPHFTWNPPITHPPTMVVALGFDRAFCATCIRKDQLHAEGFANQTHCDVCEEPTNTFYPFIFPNAGILFTGDTCEDCLAFATKAR